MLVVMCWAREIDSDGEEAMYYSTDLVPCYL